ncbi:MAG TPA: YdcF family protein [Anaerolineales bacterium]|nr:YdcF family protein [Anaerolineales bacterium]
MPIANALIEVVSELFKALLPGSLLFLLIGLTIGVVLLLSGEGRKMRGRAWLAGLAILYWLLSMPIVAGGMESLLGAGYGPIASAAQAEDAQTVVVLTGGSVTLQGEDSTFDILSTASSYRMLEAERLYHLLGEPTLILSGGPPGGTPSANPESEAMKSELVARGIPESKILVETEAVDTHDEAVRVAEMLENQGIDSFVLVTSTEHMRRALGSFAAQGLAPVPSAADQQDPGGSLAGARLLPSADALSRSYQAMREGFALLYYALRGWLG